VEIDMKKTGGKIVLYVVLGIVILSVVYTACKDITPEQKRIETTVELKVSK
jgi:hypothetical protein